MAADYEKLYNWLYKGRPNGQEPKVLISTKKIKNASNTFRVNFPWNDKKVVLDFLGELQKSGFPFWSTWSWERYLKNIR